MAGLLERWKQKRLRDKALADALIVRREARRLLRRYRHRLTEAQAAELGGLLAELEGAMSTDAELGPPLNKLEDRLEKLLPGARRSPHREYAQSIGVAVLIALVLRAFVVEAFKIPSGSMIPTLQVGDYIFVNKFLYGVRLPFTNWKIADSLRKPKRGEVVVFVYPVEPDKDFIKRIAAIEGDTIDIRDNVIHINGQPLQRAEQHDDCRYFDYEESTSRWQQKLCDGVVETNGTNQYTAIYRRAGLPSSFDAVTVPPGMVFVMGDNRDFSNDSRYWGFVPQSHIKGRAMVIWWSAGPGSDPVARDSTRTIDSFFDELPSLRSERLFKLVR